MQKKKSGEKKPTRSTTSSSKKWKSPGDEIIDLQTQFPSVVLPSKKNSQLSKMLLESAKKGKWRSTVAPTQMSQVLTRRSQVETQMSQVPTQKPQILTQVQTPKYKVKPVLIVFWSTWFGKRLDLDESWSTSHCPVECKVTSDLSRAKDANAFIVHARDPYPLPPRDNVPWILYTQENPVYTPVLRQAEYMSKFKLLKSYRLDSDFPDPTFTVPNFKPPIPFKNKTGFIMAAFSNCERVRMEYMRQLMTFVTVDSYGACLKTAGGLIHRYGSEDFREQKTALARKYKFLLVFFNQDCDYFVDDQLVHALNAGAVPIIMATDKIGQFMRGNLRNAYINVRNFENPKRLAEYLTFLGNNEAEYNKYLEWKFKGFGDIDDTVIGKHFHPPYPPYCQVCVAVSKGNVHEKGLKPDLCIERRFADWNITVGGEMNY